ISRSCLSCSGVSGPLQPCCSRSARRSRELSGERMSCTNSIKNSRPSMPTSGAPGSCWNRRSMAARTTRNRLSVCSTCVAEVSVDRQTASSSSSSRSTRCRLSRSDGRGESASMNDASPRSAASADAARMRGMSAISVDGPYSSRHRASTRRIARVSRLLLTPGTGATATEGSELRGRTDPGAGRGGGSTHVGRENTKLQVAGLHPLLILLCKDRAELAAPRLGGQSIPDARHGKWARRHVVGGEVGTDRKGPRRQRFQHPAADREERITALQAGPDLLENGEEGAPVDLSGVRGEALATGLAVGVERQVYAAAGAEIVTQAEAGIELEVLELPVPRIVLHVDVGDSGVGEELADG